MNFVNPLNFDAGMKSFLQFHISFLFPTHRYADSTAVEDFIEYPGNQKLYVLGKEPFLASNLAYTSIL